MTDSKGSAQSKRAAVNFYKHILRYKNPSNKPYGIVNLIGHRGSASTSVRDIAKNPKELKDFFLLNPDVFIVTGEFVSLSKKHSAIGERKLNSKKNSAQDISLAVNKSVKSNLKVVENNSSIPKKNERTNIKGKLTVDLLGAVEFYFIKLFTKCKYDCLPFARLIGYRNIACPEIQSVAKNPESLKAFLANFPTLFMPSKKKVTIAKPVLIKSNCLIYYLDKFTELGNAEISFDELYSTNNIQSNNTIPTYVKETIRSSAGLKNFLSSFTDIFRIRDNLVCINPEVFIQLSNESYLRMLISKAVIQQEVKCLNLDSLKKLPLSTNKAKKESKSENNINMYSDTSVHCGEVNQQPVEFFLGKLWQHGLCRVLSINDLYKFKSQASQEIQSVCGSNAQEFRAFLTSYPESFIVTGENVLARRNIPRKKWSPPYRGVEEPMSTVIVNFFKMYTQNGQPVKIETLYYKVGNCFFKNDGQPFFESPRQLKDFLNMFPQIFYANNDSVVNILYQEKGASKNIPDGKTPEKSKVVSLNSIENCRKMKNVKVNITANLGHVTRNSLNWKDEVLLKTKMVSTLELCQEICRKLMGDKVIAVDCEGYNLGIYGRMSLVQIARPCGEVYVFDVYKNPSFLNSGGLSEVLESSEILKVIHDSKNDYANLLHEFRVTLRNIFDTRVAHYVISFPNRKCKSYPCVSFNVICKTYGAPINIEKDKFKDIYKYEPDFWLRRPLDEDMLAYAALDVACLVPHVYNAMSQNCVGLESRIISLSESHSRSTS